MSEPEEMVARSFSRIPAPQVVAHIQDDHWRLMCERGTVLSLLRLPPRAVGPGYAWQNEETGEESPPGFEVCTVADVLAR